MKHSVCRILPILLVVFLVPKITQAQRDSLLLKFKIISRTIPADIGIAVRGMEDGDTISFNAQRHYPMQSVYKFPLAMAVLHQVDSKKLRLDQKIQVSKKDLLPDTHSPMRDKYPAGEVDLTLAEILRFTVSQSDNNGCDILFRLLGGTKTVNDYVHRLGVKEISIMATEEEMHAEWNVQFTNWSTPKAMLQLLEIFWRKRDLSMSSTDFLSKCMVETATGSKRIKGLLPHGTVVAHKTGLSDTNEEGITAATNDVGIVTLPNGKHFAIVVFVSNTKASQELREKVIAQISKAVWDYFLMFSK